MTAPTADIRTGDALPLLADQRGAFASVFTSLPDAAEMGLEGPAWAAWFAQAARLTVEAVTPKGYAIFYQTDRRADGRLRSKAGLVIEAAQAVGASVVWHKIAVATEGTSLFRPAFTHLLAVSVRGKSAKPTPDVFPIGPKVYPNATDEASLDVGLGFLAGKGVGWIADPFCGRGSIARAAASRYGMGSLSVDVDPGQVDAARALLAPHATVTDGGRP
ncbi:hypothetical protein [Nocardioides nanhaiensis]|uniref:Methyltransferase n=1 Tax=Nocardioides nanhaiensis TaxID=1476871 RepID=A0ABP8W398_9ACTN